jgi:putative hemolysin
MRLVLALAMALTLAACATEREGGVANYDGLKQAQEKCAAQGGKLVLKDQGNSQWLDAYSCKGK